MPVSLGTAVSSRPKQLLGVLFSIVGVGHFGVWTQRDESGFAHALTTGDAAAAVAALSTYAGAHPAYVLAVLCGLALIAWAWRE